MAQVVGRLKQSADTLALGDRVFPEGPGELEFFVELNDWWDRRDFVLEGQDDTTVDVELVCEGEADMHLYDGAGNSIQESQQDPDVEWLNAALPSGGVYFLQVAQGDGELARCSLSSNVRLRQLPDPDDGRSLVKGKPIAGNLDHFRDFDWYSINLKEGEMVEVVTDSLNVDTVLYIRCQGCGRDEIAQNDDSGEGLFRANARVTYRATFDGEYVIGVDAAVSGDGGGYYLSVKRAASGSALTPLSGEHQAASLHEGEALADRVFDCLVANEDAKEFLISSAEQQIVEEGMDRDLARSVLELLLNHRSTFVSAMGATVAEDPADFEEFLETWCKETDPQVEYGGSNFGPLFHDKFGDGRVFGPLNGVLRHDPSDGKIERKAADVRLDDFLVSATFLNPYSGDSATWDYGFYLRDDRDLEAGRFGYLVVTSEGRWSLRWRDRATGNTTEVSSGRLDDLDAGAGGQNVLELAVFGESGLLFVNGTFVAMLDVSDMADAGDVAVITGAFKNHEVSGSITRFRDFEVWSLAKVHDSAGGEIEIGPDGLGRHSSGVGALDFVVEAEFLQPAGVAWHLGFVVRSAGPDRFDSVVVDGDNAWFHGWKAGEVDLEVSGEYATSGPEDRTHLLLIAFGPVGFLLVDGGLSSRLDLSGNSERGEVLLVGGTDDENIGEMRFKNFRVWVPS